MDLVSKRAAILKMLDRGQSHKDIIKALGVSRTFIWRTKKVFQETGKISRKPGQGRKRTVRTPRLAKAIAAKVRRNPARSMNKLAQEYNVSRSTVMRVVKEDLGMRPYKHRQKQLLSEATKDKRKQRSKLLLQWYEDHPDVIVIFSDEKLFEATKKFNHQNDRILARDTSSIPPGARDVYRTQKPASIMVWGAVASNGKKSPLFRIPDGVKINRIVYLDFLKTKVMPWIQQEFHGAQICFQQDGAPAHTANVVQEWCKANFDHFWPKDFWPPSSPDCNPLDFAM